MPSITQQYNAYRGDTWVSRKYIFIEEEVPPGTTEEEIIAGIESGRFHHKDLREYQIDADVFVDVGLWFPLTDYLKIDSLGRFMHFEMTASKTNDIADAPNVADKDFPITGRYDIQFCKKNNGVVETLWSGDFALEDDITKRDPCKVV
ncbi:hypothetical protein [Photobacterium indicum]|uniref:Uncharacterized protein n=1 Tax=Photobacterium indicum TaxID=81447 RepID=A0A2T3L3D6_9GAMM|nr:hypothetical protein [Photobacterium indicum]PSV43613.1 hypothetical protein C9J47_22355 [Photobacterium indicum]